MKNGFIRVGTASPALRIADPRFNANELIRCTHSAESLGVRVLVFPELALTTATCGDLFFHETLLNGAWTALEDYLNKTKETAVLSFVGLPVSVGQRLYNCAAVCFEGSLLGLVPKQTILHTPPYQESRYFEAAKDIPATRITLYGTEVWFGTNLLFAANEFPALCVSAEIGADAAQPIPPSIYSTAAGATVVCNLSATPEMVGSSDFRKQNAQSLSARALVGYLVCEAGIGESTTDLVFGGQQLIYENGKLLSERKAFEAQSEILYSELDLDRILYERRRSSLSFKNSNHSFQTVIFSMPIRQTDLSRKIDPHPFIPAAEAVRADRFEQILTLQANGLKARIERAYAKKIVIGISGGLDSTLALLVMVRALDLLGRSYKDIIAVTMPCFGTTQRTKTNATILCEELGVDFRCVDIYDAVNIHFRDIAHDPEDHNVTYENAQARERTQILMDIANECGGMVIGTGDLSELALGWATYNGDHMSMYGVNAAVPKTLVRHLVAHCAKQYEKDGATAIATALRDVLDTPVSPELLPATEGGDIAQKTEDLVGPYELHDFYLYHMLRYGTPPAKLYRLARSAFDSSYSDEVLKKWLKVFIRRFFTQQFKRSCLPDGPKVGSVGLSPRGDWCMPSDAAAALWQEEAETL